MAVAVKSHTREGHKVKSYTRGGKGKAAAAPAAKPTGASAGKSAAAVAHTPFTSVPKGTSKLGGKTPAESSFHSEALRQGWSKYGYDQKGFKSHDEFVLTSLNEHLAKGHKYPKPSKK